MNSTLYIYTFSFKGSLCYLWKKSYNMVRVT